MVNEALAVEFALVLAVVLSHHHSEELLVQNPGWKLRTDSEKKLFAIRSVGVQSSHARRRHFGGHVEFQ
jgi:hypothetical protein